MHICIHIYWGTPPRMRTLRPKEDDANEPRHPRTTKYELYIYTYTHTHICHICHIYTAHELQNKRKTTTYEIRGTQRERDRPWTQRR